MFFNVFEKGHIIYTVYLFALLIVTLFTYKRTNKQNLVLFVFFIIAQVLIGGLRSYSVGTDTGSYVLYFYQASQQSVREIFQTVLYKDPVFYLFAKALSCISNDYPFILFGLQAFFWVCVAIILYKYSDRCLLALSLLIAMRFHFFAMSGLRQAMAMSIIFLSFHYLLGGKNIRFLVLVAIAALFHSSAVLCVIALLFNRFNLRGILPVVFLSIGVLALAFILPDINFDEELSYSNYITNTSDDLGNKFSFMITALAFGLIFILIKNKYFDDLSTNLLYNLSLCAFLLSLMGVRLVFAYRVSMYFGFFMPVLISNLIGESTNKRELVFLIICAIIVIYVVTGVPVGLIHHFFWEDGAFLY